MTSVPIIFNKKLIEKRIQKISIPDYQKKYDTILAWKKDIDSGIIKNKKEEELQGPFFSRIFEMVLGYSSTGDGGDSWSLDEEKKTEKDGTKSDGAVGIFSNTKSIVKSVIELKGLGIKLDKPQQSRSDRKTPVEQGFSYALGNGTKCEWIIVSDFDELRLYRNGDDRKYEHFNLSKMNDENEFKRFYLLLSKENLISENDKSNTIKLYEENEKQGEEITSKFYQRYKSLRTELFDELKINNPDINPLILYQKSQKILDRFIFICFCEDKDLLERNTTEMVVNNALGRLSCSDFRVWEGFVDLFNAIDKGDKSHNINGYNGGLFKYDFELDCLKIPNEPLIKLKDLATEYDFDSDLNVNILGHIFEQSISDIEEETKKISGTLIDKKEGKQKKDGIFYTPHYVTDYISKGTIGRWIEDTKESVKKEIFVNGDFKADIEIEAVGKRLNKKSGKRSNKKYKSIIIKEWKELPDDYEILDRYENKAIIKLHYEFWRRFGDKLLNIKILDPACGSGAFLNQAFDFLTKEIEYSRDMQRSFLTDQTTFSEIEDLDKYILQNNIYGVDLNSESVEITKLSLWLKTADKNKQLTTLDNNIICHNSIVCEDPNESPIEMWSKLFPEVMLNGGFDIVIGNPPYIGNSPMGAKMKDYDKEYIKNHFETQQGHFDTYLSFIELGLKLTKQNGYFGFITPITYFNLDGCYNLRKFVFNNHTLIDLIVSNDIFEGPTIGQTAISIYNNVLPSSEKPFSVILYTSDKKSPRDTFINSGEKLLFKQSDLKIGSDYKFNFSVNKNSPAQKMRDRIFSLSAPLKEYVDVFAGIKLYETGKGIPKQTDDDKNNKIYECYEKIDETWLPCMYGEVMEKYCNKWDGWYIKYGKCLAAMRKPKTYAQPKLLVRQTGDSLIGMYDDSGILGNATLHCIVKRDDKPEISLYYILGLYNSKFMTWIYQYENPEVIGKPKAQVKKYFVEELPYIISDSPDTVINIVKSLLQKCQAKYDISKEFAKYIVNKYSLDNTYISKLQNIYNWTFKEFIDKSKIKISSKDEIDLMNTFDEYKEKIKSFEREISKLKRDLDYTVYDIYQLTDDEINIIESNQ